MIPARRRDWVVFGAERVLQLAVRRQFRGLYLVNRTRLDLLEHSRPVVAVANHSNWWDGFVIFLMGRLLPERTFYLAQEERHLARYPFLSRIGAFGLDLQSPRAGLKEALRLLASPRNVVWMFPQGALVPSWQPLEIKGGANLLARRSGAQLLPVALRYEWLQESRASIVVNFGAPLPPDTSPENLGQAMTDTYREVDEQIAQIDLEGFEPMIRPRRSINRLWDSVRGLESDPMNR